MRLQPELTLLVPLLGQQEQRDGRVAVRAAGTALGDALTVLLLGTSPDPDTGLPASRVTS